MPGARIRVPPETRSSQSGGPMRRAVYRTQDGSMVLRTPHQVVYDTEPGGARFPGIDTLKFLPDGRLVPRTALGGSFGAVMPSASLPMDAGSALVRLQTMYADLQIQAGKIIKAFAGQIVPCGVRSSYNKAVKSYLDIGAAVIDQLVKKGMKPVQFVKDREGKFVTDAEGHVKTLTVEAPLRPTVFVVSDCPPGTTALSGADVFGGAYSPSVAEFGIAPAIVGAYALCAANMLVCFALVAAGVYLTKEAVKDIIISWPTDRERYQRDQKGWVDAYLSCVEGATSRGVPAMTADAQCKLTAGPAPAPPGQDGGGGMGALGWIGLVTLLVGVGAIGGFFAFRAASPVERERKRRILEADMEAQRLSVEAARVRHEARDVPRFASRRQHRSGGYEAGGGGGDDMDGAFGGSSGGQGARARFRGCVCFD